MGCLKSCCNPDLLAQIWIGSFKWGTMEPCKLKDCKVTSLQSLPRPDLDPGPHSSIAILAESDQAILMIFFRKFWKHITLQEIDIESLIIPHLKYLIHICLEPEDQDPSRNFNVLSFNLNFINNQKHEFF